MATTPQTHGSTSTATAYAQSTGRRSGSGKRWLILGSVAVVGALSLGAISRSTGLLGRVLGNPPASASVFVVKPSDLVITLNENGELKPKNSIEIKSEVEGQATLLFVVAESSRVKKGDLLVELASDELVERLSTEAIQERSARAELESATQELSITLNENSSKIEKATIDLDVAILDLEQYTEGEYEKSRLAANIDIQQTELEINRKAEELRKSEALVERGFVTKAKIDELKDELKKAEMTLEKNKMALDILNRYDKPKAVKQKTSAVDQARGELERERQRGESKEKQARAKVEEQTDLLASRVDRVERLRKAVSKCKILSPVDGIVQYPQDDAGMRGGGNRIAAGEKVFEGQTLVVLPDTSQMVVNTRIHEADRHHVREGLACEVRVPAVPGRTFNGHIARIAQFADSAHRWFNPELKEHTTEILLDETDAPVSPGDTAEIKILIDNVPGVLAIPVQCVFPRGSRNFVFLDGDSSKPVEIKVGRSSSTMVEIVKGLSPGDRVMMLADEEMLTHLPSNIAEPTAQKEKTPPRAKADATKSPEASDATPEKDDADKNAPAATEAPADETKPASVEAPAAT